MNTLFKMNPVHHILLVVTYFAGIYAFVMGYVTGEDGMMLYTMGTLLIIISFGSYLNEYFRTLYSEWVSLWSINVNGEDIPEDELIVRAKERRKGIERFRKYGDSWALLCDTFMWISIVGCVVLVIMAIIYIS